MSASLELTVVADDLTPAQRVQITRELDEWITHNVPGVRTSTVSAPLREGDKGIEIAIGSLLLALVNAGVATALVNCLTTYITQRRRTIKLEVKDAAGRSVSFDAANVGRAEMDALMGRMTDLAHGAEVPAR